jgi:hypothetical protein
MQKIIAILMVLAIVAFVALAGQVYGRATKTIGTTGAATWTNTIQYAALELKRIWIENASATNQTVAISRVTSDGAYTQTVGSIAIGALTAGSTASFTAAYLSYGDKLTFASTGGIAATGGVAIIEYEVQQH